MRDTLQSWAAYSPDHPEDMNQRGYQSYLVLSLCRILYTLKFSEVVSKAVAVRWAKEALDAQWTPLIDRALEGRRNSNMPATEEDKAGTLDFIRWSYEYLVNGSEDEERLVRLDLGRASGAPVSNAY